MKKPLTLDVKQDGNRVVITADGIIDTNTSQELSDALLALDYSGLDLTLDFTDVSYITSAGLRVLLVARKKLSDEAMRIIGVNDDVADIFEITGFSDFLNFTRAEKVSENSLNMSFKALLRRKSTESGGETAFSYLDRDYTWSEVEKAAQIIASDLSKMGVKKGSHVGICAPNSINWVFSFFAVQKLGGIAVLVNFSLKPSEIAVLSEIGGFSCLCYGAIPGVTDFAAYNDGVRTGESRITDVYDIGANVDFTERFSEYDAIKNDFFEMFHADDASVIIFTSGSTGRPKAVLSSSFNMICGILPLIKKFRMSKEDRNCAFLPFFHVFGFSTSIVIGLLVGMASYIPTSSKPNEVLGVIEKNRCTVFHSVPTIVLMMIGMPGFSPERAKTLRLSALGGAATSEAQMTALRRIFPNNHFCNVYGMSENAAISITGYEDTVAHITKTVGKPVEGTQVEIRDVSTGRRLPTGEPGEVFVRSKAMIVCYYGLAIEKQPLDDEGWLATGDLGVLDEDGYLRLVGRAKDLIIRGGENISPSEVAAAVAEIDEIADVKVLGVPHETLGEEVAAAVIIKPGAKFDEEAVRSYLSERLARFKVPKYFVTVKNFPMLGSGKVDALKLKKMVLERLESAE